MVLFVVLGRTWYLETRRELDEEAAAVESVGARVCARKTASADASLSFLVGSSRRRMSSRISSSMSSSMSSISLSAKSSSSTSTTTVLLQYYYSTTASLVLVCTFE